MSSQQNSFVHAWTFASVTTMYTFLQGVVNNNNWKKGTVFELFIKPDCIKSGKKGLIKTNGM